MNTAICMKQLKELKKISRQQAKNSNCFVFANKHIYFLVKFPENMKI